MIQRLVALCNCSYGCVDYEKDPHGDLVFYNDHLAEIAGFKSAVDSLLTETHRLDAEVSRLEEALTEILEYPEERASHAIAEKALEGGVK